MTAFPVSYVQHTVVVELPRRVDVTNTDRFLEITHELIARETRTIVLDLGATESLDSTALGAIVQVYKQLRRREGSLLLADVRRPIDRLLKLTRLDDILARFGTVVDAVGYRQRAA